MRRAMWAGALLLASAGMVLAQAGTTVTVTQMSAKLGKSPSFLAPTVSKLVRGDQLTVIEVQKDWYHAKTRDGQDGWINRTSVVDKAVALSTKPGGGQGGVSNDEVAMAGRGFSPEVEAAYKKDHPDLDYSHVDKIEKLDVDGAALARFRDEGKIGGGK